MEKFKRKPIANRQIDDMSRHVYPYLKLAYIQTKQVGLCASTTAPTKHIE